MIPMSSTPRYVAHAVKAGTSMPRLHRTFFRTSSSSFIASRSRSSCSYFNHQYCDAKILHNNYHHSHFRRYQSNLGKYDSFRRHMIMAESSSSSNSSIEQKKGFQAAQQAVTILAQKNRTWDRLSHIVELATAKSSSTSTSSVIADIGCDHGLLAIALAASGKFTNVIGSDVSSRAIEDGALSFHTKVMEILSNHEVQGVIGNDYYDEDPTKNDLPVEFRVGDGLQTLKQGEAEAICIAGMGVHTMLSIILEDDNDDNDNDNGKTKNICKLDELRCNHLYLQPPTSRPRKMMQLYRIIQDRGWILSNERILKLKKRWYITCAFDRVNDDDDDDGNGNDNGNGYDSNSDSSITMRLPGHFLSEANDEEQKTQYDAYVKHHIQWLNNDFMRKGTLCQDDLIWREANMDPQ